MDLAFSSSAAVSGALRDEGVIDVDCGGRKENNESLNRRGFKLMSRNCVLIRATLLDNPISSKCSSHLMHCLWQYRCG